MGSDSVTADPLSRFEAEHADALVALDKLEAAALALERGDPPGALLAVVREVHRILTTEVREHNDNEERALFSLLGEDAPTAVFVEEHGTLRQLEHALVRAADAPDAARRVPPVARQVVALLRAHIARENDVLFPMARAVLGPEGLAAVAQRLGS